MIKKLINKLIKSWWAVDKNDTCADRNVLLRPWYQYIFPSVLCQPTLPICYPFKHKWPWCSGSSRWVAYVCGRLTFVGETMGLFPRWPRLLCAGGQWGGTAQKKAEHGNKTFNFCRGVGAASQKRGGITWPQKPEFVGGWASNAILQNVYQLFINFYKYFINFLSSFINFLSTFYQLFINVLSTFYQLFINFLSAFYQLFINFLSTCYQLSAFYKSPPPRKYLIVSVAQVFSDCLGRSWCHTPWRFKAITAEICLTSPNTQSGSQWVVLHSIVAHCCTACFLEISAQPSNFVCSSGQL